MVCVFVIASVVLLSMSATGSPIKEKNDNKDSHDLTDRNLVLKINPKETRPITGLKPMARSDTDSLTNQRSLVNNDRKSRSKAFAGSGLMHNNIFENSEGRVVREPLLALIPIRNRRIWRRRNFHMYNTVPDASYHFDSYAIDPMFYFLGIGK